MQNVQQSSTVSQTTRDEIERIVLESDIGVKFHRVISLENNEIVGYKASPKGPLGSSLENTDTLTSVAQEHGLSDELEYATLVAALSFQHKLPDEHFLSIDIGANLFLSKLFREITNLCQHIAHQVVFELTEHIPHVELAFMEKRVKEIQEIGYRIALNSAENDGLDYERTKKLKPAIVKLDVEKLEHIAKSDAELLTLRSAMADLQANQIALHAEGVDNTDQASKLLELGITFGQGELSAFSS